MKYFFGSFLFTCFFSISLIANLAHTESGTEYGPDGVNAYAESNHGPDGGLFLDPYFKKDIEKNKNKKILDAGCGSAPWAIYAAEHGGQVYAIDIQDGMIEAALTAIQQADLTNKIHVTKGDVACLPYEADFFDKEISICVGCNLPPESFEKHFLECWRTLKKDGLAVIGAPNSLDVVFSDGSKTEAEVFFHIQEVLQLLPDNPSSDVIASTLLQLKEVLSATFYINNNRLALVANESDLKIGEPIWRKLPKLVIPNRFYSKEYYISIFKKHNFDIKSIDQPHFNSEEARVHYNEKAAANAKLGKEYVAHAPFVIFHVKKSAHFGNKKNQTYS